VIGALRFAAGLALAAVVHVAATSLLPAYPRFADLFLVATLVAARHRRAERALVAGSFAGWTADVLAATPFGLFGFADAAVGYFTALVARRLVIERNASLIGLFAAAGAAQGLILFVLGMLVAADGAAPGPAAIVVRAASAALIGPAWIGARSGLAQRWRRRRRGAARRGSSLVS
jgi:rod shape-determining protein MreD